jgi:hypothetical protein
MLTQVQLLVLGLSIANRAAICDIESECVAVDDADGRRWFDIRPMIDPNEHCGEVIDMMVDTLTYAEESGLIRRHAEQRYLVRITSPET